MKCFTKKWKKCLCAIAVLMSAQIGASAQNPYLPMWEYIPDGEPYVFDDPDNPGKKRVYIYGSHDSMITGYCGRELVTWSASLDSIDHWRYDGVIFEVAKNAKGQYLHKEKWGDVLYAPDVVEKTERDGTKTYYLYPNNQGGGRNGMVAKSKRPDGPFEVINWNAEKPDETVGVLGFDPAVFIDDDGRVYGYWGFKDVYAAELDPQTMATVKPGTPVLEKFFNSKSEPGIYRFFEASSMRKIKDKYVLIYSRHTGEGEFGLPASNYTLAYSYSNSPLGPFVYGGTIIDGRGRDLDENGVPMFTAHPNGNTHGSICEINGKWWVFYHRQVGQDEYSRQAMVAPIDVEVTEGPDGRVSISEAEYNSEGFRTEGLNPLKRHSAGIACYYTGPKPAVHQWPNKIFYGSYVAPRRLDGIPKGNHYDLSVNHNPVVNNTAGSIVGYKYFNFDHTHGVDNLQLLMNVVPAGIDATIEIWVNSPYVSRGGVKIGSMSLTSAMKQIKTELKADVSGLSKMRGKKALFFVMKSNTAERSLCEIHDFVFASK